MKRLVIVLGTLMLSALVAQFAMAAHVHNNGILLVDDDGSCGGSLPNVLSAFTDALDASGFQEAVEADFRGEYEIYEVAVGDTSGPDFAKMMNYAGVIWFTGATCCSDPNCLSKGDEAELGAYLEAGGKLFLSAQDYLSYFGDGDLPAGSFPREYLRVDACTTNVWVGPTFTVVGPPSPDPEAITEDMTFTLMNPFAKSEDDLYIDKLVPYPPDPPEKVDPIHHVIGEFSITDMAGTGYAALSWNEFGTLEGAHVFFTTVSFAALVDGPSGTKQDLMGRIMGWMLGDYADYGDAPDPPYPSYFESQPPYGGARHINSEENFEWLGPEIDQEFNTWQTRPDFHDDGVVLNTPFAPGETGSVNVTVTVSNDDWLTNPGDASRYFEPWPMGGGGDYIYMYLSAWCDWNQDDDWYDNFPDNYYENIIHNFRINPVEDGWTSTSHTYNIDFPVPSWATNNDMWCRFRLAFDDTFKVFEVYDYKSFGEVEDYVIDHPLSVGLSTFYASAGDGQATLYWSTQSETNNLGFYLMRSDGGDWLRVNQDLIPGHGTSETSHEYRYVDKGLVNGVTYSYKVVDVDLAGTQSAHGPITVTPMADAGVPTDYALSQNYPNPFNANTTISYAIPQDSHVSVKIYNIVGEEVRTLVDSHQSANTYQVTWDSKDAAGKSVSSGVYFCTLSAGEFSATTKMVYMR